MEYKQLRHNFICYLKEHYDYARPEAMASNVFYTWHNDIGIDFWEIFKSEEAMKCAKELLIKRFEAIGRKNPRGHAEVHFGCWKKFHEFLMSQPKEMPSFDECTSYSKPVETLCNSSELDLLTAMDNLCLKRRLFHSEADFQFALAWEIQTLYSDADVRLEYCPKESPHMHIDIIVKRNGKVYPIELKYKTLAMDCSIEGEYYNLKSHGAQDIGKYDCLIDIQRLEQCREMLPSFGCGFVIWLTNDSAYWKAPQKEGTMAKEFTLYDGVCKNGTMEWAPHTGDGTKKGREDAIILRDFYTIRWRHYSTVSDKKAGKFRYVILSIK